MLLCVSVPSFRLQVALHDCAGVAYPAVVLADKFERGRVLECNAAAKGSGARPGMTLLQAQAAAHDVSVLVHDGVRSAQLWEDILDALDAVSPLVDDSGQGLAYLWMQGVRGTPESWLANARAALAGFDLPFRLAIGANKFAARAAALVKDGSICEPGTERALLAPLGVEVLGMEAETVARLELLGVKTLGDLAALPHGPFVRRFGSRAAAWHRHAQGVDVTPFLPRPHQLQIEAQLAGEGAAESEDQVYFALRILIGRVHDDLARAGKRAGVLLLKVECENGDAQSIEIRIAQPTSDRDMLFDLTRARFEGRTFEAPVTGLWLQATQLEDGGVPATLFAGSDPDPAVVELALARLEAALAHPAQRASVVPGNRLEAQFTYEPFAGMPPPLPAGVSACPSRAVPQMRLLDVREIDVRVLKAAPAFVGSPPQAVLDYAGPWRVRETWFERPVARDEYDVLLEDGALYRIFRQGAQWYLRGAYD